MTVPSPAPSVPGWEILGFVGSGGMGDVWKARRADGRVAAIKVARTAKRLTDEEAGSLFRREALACLEIDHPHLVRGLDAGTTSDGRAFLALEFVEGATLDELVRKGGALPEARLVELGIALARALGHAHRLGLLHRDVKPKNVVLGPNGVVKLLDLGLAELTEDAGSHRMGSPGYAAPEVVAGEIPNERADLYSLGATLAAAATGEIPTREKGFAGRALPETAGRFALSPGVRRVIERLLRADPAARYGTAAQVVLDLEALAAGERPLGAILGASGARAARKWPWVAACVASALAGVVWLATREDDAPPDAPPSVAPSPSPRAADAKLEAAKVYVVRYPADFARGRELLADADTPSLTGAEREELKTLRDALEARYLRLADEALSDRMTRAQSALVGGDVVAALATLRDWPRDLRDSPQQKRAEQTAEQWRAAAVEGATKLADGIESDAASNDHVREAAALSRAEAALARPSFEGDQRARFETARAALLKSAEERGLRDAAADSVRNAERVLDRRMHDHFKDPSSARLRAVIAAALEPSLPADLRDAAADVLAALERGEKRVADALTRLQDRRWCGPRGDAMFAGTVKEPPSPEEVYLSRMWHATGGRLEALAVTAGGRDEARAWLFARGGWDESAVTEGGALARLFAVAPPMPAGGFGPFLDEGAWRADFTLREPKEPVGRFSSDDPVLNEWALAIAGGARAADTRTKAQIAAADAAKTRGRDAFLADDLASAWKHLTEAESLAPRDAEISALRGRVLLTGARTLPTAPALFLAFSEGRRAWDLDPKMPAGPVLAAEAGVDLLAVATAEFAARARPAVAAACEAAETMGREDARMLTCAGEWNLDGGRVQKALLQLRRAAAKAPRAAPTLIALARAEHAAGNAAKARAALATAADVLGGALPPQAAELAKTLEKR